MEMPVPALLTPTDIPVTERAVLVETETPVVALDVPQVAVGPVLPAKGMVPTPELWQPKGWAWPGSVTIDVAVWLWPPSEKEVECPWPGSETLWPCAPTALFSRLVSAVPVVPSRVPAVGMPTIVLPETEVASRYPVGQDDRLKNMTAPGGTAPSSELWPTRDAGPPLPNAWTMTSPPKSAMRRTRMKVVLFSTRNVISMGLFLNKEGWFLF